MVNAGRKLSLILFGMMFVLPVAVRAQSAAPAAASSEDLQKLISRLNAAAAKFESAQADFSWNQLLAAVQDNDLQSGTIYFERKQGATRTAVDIKTENDKPAPRTVVYNRGEVDFYQPEIKQIRVIRAGANQGQWESFLTLGFGGSGTDLQTNWKVTLQGSEKIDGVSVAKLDLVPVQPKVLELFTHVTIWIDPTRGVSLKQIFYQPGGDMRTATYTNIRYNKPVPNDVFKIVPAPGTTTVVQ